MAYQFFPKAQRNSSIPTPSRPSHPPIHPPPPQPPKSATGTKTRQNTEDPFTPYLEHIPNGYRTSHPHVTVESIGTAHIPSLMRITGLLLPIRYPNSFYTATITDPVIASLSRVAIYHDHPVATIQNGSTLGSDKVIGAIRCRLERLESQHETNLYIQTLHLLSPYRGQGVAAALLNSLLFDDPPSAKSKGKTRHRVSKLVQHYRIRTVTAHVHEANEDGLRWYIARGFKVEDGVVEGYYRRLKPSGARIVRLDLECPQEEQVDPVDANGDAGEQNEEVEEEGWEKVEANDGEEDDHGVQLLPDSQSFGEDNSTTTTPTRKRKAEDEKGNQPQRR